MSAPATGSVGSENVRGTRRRSHACRTIGAIFMSGFRTSCPSFGYRDKSLGRRLAPLTRGGADALDRVPPLEILGRHHLGAQAIVSSPGEVVRKCQGCPWAEVSRMSLVAQPSNRNHSRSPPGLMENGSA